MDKEELGKLYPITVVEYDAKWTTSYEQERNIIVNILGPETALSVEHIGSAAVPNLSAKPTIDILVEIPDAPGVNELIISKMSENNYILMQEQTSHLMFVKGYTPTGLEEISFHIHMGTRNQAFLWDRIYFRDYLRMYPSVASEYESLKLKLAEIYKHDRDAYTENKGDFIRKITSRAKESLSTR
ncbi:GrpB family protein [Alicyclobacillus dauci]|uniref:GrpB family protein n=1 Tax=Alicyclobacillus dauci TaxID=1475485 RepID=A0ABY6Z037_9BACL|nr:GrpB family protein [Alicyclobacillus dauci]WAH35883.1 GrpB family protein [Alicyclobacillus dauci]